jgi:antitoxin component HigA of HigAB toxin-antitoxin module
VLSGNVTSAQGQMLDSLSDLLGVSSDDLAEQLGSGTSLADLLQQKGVTLADVASTLQSGFLVDVRA